MVSAGDFRNGVTFEEDGNVLQALWSSAIKPGKGAAFVRTGFGGKEKQPHRQVPHRLY